jgi:glycosyltransferase involved in cell wall biosynthesis
MVVSNPSIRQIVERRHVVVTTVLASQPYGIALARPSAPQPVGESSGRGAPGSSLRGVGDMRIAHVIDSGGLYGAEAVVLELASEQRRMGQSPLIVSIGTPGIAEKPIERAARARQIDVTPVRMKPGLNPAGALRLLTVLRERRTDIVHAHGYKADILLGLVPRRLRRIPMITTVHGYTHAASWNRLALYGWLDRQMLRRMDGVVLVHEGMAAKPGLGRLHDPLWRVIENGIPAAPRAVDPSALDPRIAHFCQGGAVVGAIGRLSPEKGFADLIAAFERVAARQHAARLIVLGEGPERARLEGLVAARCLGERVFFPGYVDNAAAYLPRFDAFVLPSLTEGLPITLLEAMRAERAIVATRVGGVPSVLQGGSGIVVPPGDVEALAAAVVTLLERRDVAASLAAAASEAVTQSFSSAGMAQRYTLLYRELVDSHWSSEARRPVGAR